VATRQRPGRLSRTRWDVLIEAASAGWQETMRLTLLLLAMNATACGAVVAVAHLVTVFWLRH
jgi:hypothetical protein